MTIPEHLTPGQRDSDRIDPARLRARYAEHLRRAGAEHPHIGAAVAYLRGRTGTDPDTWAAALGIDTAVLSAAEAGQLAYDQLPDSLIEALRHT